MRFHREDDKSAKPELEILLDGLDHDTAISVVRAFSFFSQLANIAEDRHHNRRRRAHRMAGSVPRVGSVAAALERLREAGVGPEPLTAFFDGALVSPVLTAHPTEVQRKSILDCQIEVARLLATRDRSDLTPHELGENEDELRRVILTLWQTRILRTTRLTVHDEIENGLAYYRHTFLRELPRLCNDIEDRVAAHLGSDRFRLAPLLRLGSWIGGDRDGNPYVTHEVTRHAVRRHSTVALDFYLGEVHALGAELSMANRLVKVSPALEALATASPDHSEHRQDEPYRRALIGIYSRLAATAQQMDQVIVERRPVAEASPYASCDEFRAELDVIAGSQIKRTKVESEHFGCAAQRCARGCRCRTVRARRWRRQLRRAPRGAQDRASDRGNRQTAPAAFAASRVRRRRGEGTGGLRCHCGAAPALQWRSAAELHHLQDGRRERSARGGTAA